jgi:glycosyltransferase involved in cell wall biosynthesis
MGSVNGPITVGVFAGTLDIDYVGGLTTYTLGIIQGLAEERNEHRIVVFAPPTIIDFICKNLRSRDSVEFVSLRLPVLRHLEGLSLVRGLGWLFNPIRNALWGGISRIISQKCDVVYFPACYLETPRITTPSVVSFHDLQHEFLPENFSWLRRRMRRLRFGETFRSSTVIQASSESMKNDALQIYGDRISPKNIWVIPEGVDFPSYARPIVRNVREKYHLPDEYLFYPAQLWPHKNHLRVLQGLKLLRDEGLRIPLVLTGGKYEASEPIFTFITENGLADQVSYLGKVPFEDLRGIYRSATYVITATLYESSSLPLIEGAATGVPLIASATPPNREAARWFRLRLFDPVSVDDLAKTLKDGWLNRQKNESDVAANRLAAERHDWRSIARAYFRLFESCAAKRKDS